MSDQGKATVSIRRGALLGLCAAAGVMFGLAVGTAGAQVSSGGFPGDDGPQSHDLCMDICRFSPCPYTGCTCNTREVCVKTNP